MYIYIIYRTLIINNIKTMTNCSEDNLDKDINIINLINVRTT